MRLQPMDDHGKDMKRCSGNMQKPRFMQPKIWESPLFPNCGISRTILCWGNALVPKARYAGWKEKGHVQVLWQEPKNQQTCNLCDNLGAKKLVQLLKTSKSTTLRPVSEADLQFPEPPNFRVAVNWLGVLLSTQLQDSVKECQHVQRQRSKTPSSWVAGRMPFPQKMQKQNMKHDFCCVSPGNQCDVSESQNGWFGNQPTRIGNRPRGIKQ